MKLQKISISENFWGPSAGWSPSAFPDSKTVAAIIANGRQLTRGGEREHEGKKDSSQDEVFSL